MYGLINESIRGLVTEQVGADAWQRIVDRSGTGYAAFAAMSYYPDEVTYSLVDAAAAELDVPADELLASFGRYWSTTIAPDLYAGYLESADRDVVSILAGLDEMHGRLQTLFPDLRPPSIEVETVDRRTVIVHYRSEREGLTPFMVGLLEGLGEVCEEPLTITQTAVRGDGADHDVFRVDRGG